MKVITLLQKTILKLWKSLWQLRNDLKFLNYENFLKILGNGKNNKIIENILQKIIKISLKLYETCEI